MNKYRNSVSLARLRELLSYDRATGHLKWLTARSGQPRPGSIAGCLAPDGYIRIRIDGVMYQAHRLAWFYVKGAWPKHEIDHRDLDRSNNVWTNLRLATHQQNMLNVKPKKRKLKYFGELKGVYPTKGGAWFGHIRVNGKARHLGTFPTKEAAFAVYCAASEKLHGPFARVA